MISYNEFLNELKEPAAPADYDRLLSQIEQKVSQRRPRARFLLAGAVAVLLLAFAAYFYYPAQQASNGDILMSYVFEQESLDGPLLAYVLED
ncbi:MAG: hypothetical protein KJ732_03755 [Candidatus Margulisbacteria bacterium]|nr:hypothetical protein [Candidatus Margulisiibacteriota bacterium]